MQNQAKAYLLTLIVVTFWGTSATAFKIALRYVTPYSLLFYSALVSSIALFVVLMVQRKQAMIFNVTFKQLVTLAFLGLLNPFCYYTILFKAYSLLPGQIAMSINYGWPFALTLLSVPLLKQKLSGVQVVAVLTSFIGALIIATKGQFTNFGNVDKVGLILVFSSTIIWASFWLVNARDQLDPVIKLFWGSAFGLLYSLLFNPILGPIQIPETAAYIPLIYIGLFEMGITFVLWLTALQICTSAARISNLIYISPFLSLLFLSAVIGETIHSATFIGLFLIVGSIIFQEKFSAKQQ